MQLYVMRHAKSDWDNALPDFERPFSKRGQKNAPAMAEWLGENDYEPDAIVPSSAVRARSTANYVAEHFDNAPTFTEHDDLYLASLDAWLDHLVRATADRLLICGHNPGLDYLVEYLGGDQPRLTDDGKLMTTAAVAVFEIKGWENIAPDTVEFVTLMRPRELPT